MEPTKKIKLPSRNLDSAHRSTNIGAMIAPNDAKASARVHTMTIDGETVDFADGETIYEVADRCRKEVPTLCYDPRLEAFGARRLRVDEVEAIRNPVPSCTN